MRFGAAAYWGIASPPISDEIEYYEPAVSIAEGLGYVMIPQQSTDGIARPTAYRMPGTAVLLSTVFAVLGSDYSVARVACLVASSTIPPLVFLYARQFADRRPSLLAGAAAVFYPSSIYYSRWILSEPFFLPALLIALIATTAALRHESRGGYCAAGACWGLTMLIRPHGLPIAALIILYIAWQGRWKEAVLFLAGVVTLMSPWVVRNVIVFRRPVLLATEGGESFLGSNNPYVLKNPEFRGMWISPMAIPEYRDRLKSIEGEFARDRSQTAMGLQYLKDHPEVVPRLVVNKFWRWLTPVTATGGVIRAAVLVSYGTLLILLALGGVFGVYKPSVPLTMTIICTAVFVGLTAVYWGNLVRGRLPLELVWLPWGAMTADALLDYSRRRFKRHREGSVAAQVL